LEVSAQNLAQEIIDDVKTKVEMLRSIHHITPGLAVIKVGNEPASEIYVNNKVAMSRNLGLNSFRIDLPDSIDQKTLLRKIQLMNRDPKIHGILVQLPLPQHIDPNSITSEIDPLKDVDGLHPMNIGKLCKNENGLVPCTPLGCLMLLKMLVSDLSGYNAVIVGRSNLVGKPMAQLLINQNATVTLCHSRTQNLASFTNKADILIVAVGKPNFIQSEFVKNQAIVIDVGMNRIAENKLTGDVDFSEVSKVAKFITPVPGGVGKMTIACLMYNTVKALCLQKDINFDTIKHIYNF
jgi:methylenetetrahydrofolate dehydrogenase (NADP+)/methenyltetrahydrofolate cyclohydrolase